MALGIILALIVAGVLIAGVDLNGAEDQPKSQTDGSAITVGEFDSVKVGRQGNSRKRIEVRFGEPQTEQDLGSGDVKGFSDPGPGGECIYYNWKGARLAVSVLHGRGNAARAKQAGALRTVVQ